MRAKNGLSEAQSLSIDAALGELFGTPDEPRLPADLPQLASLIDLEAIQQAAGPVISHEVGETQGLYRRHCARCHGITGDGRGPTARYQSPYPRDFRRGVFKWKSTYRESPPTTADLHATLKNGIPGTAMPSFQLLPLEEREILRQYVQFLAIRGQTERALADFVANELSPGDELDLDGGLREELLTEWVSPIVLSWVGAESQVVGGVSDADSRVLAIHGSDAVIGVGDASHKSLIETGRELYHSERTGCYKCHGAEGRGGAVAGKDYEIDYDLWNRDRLVVDSSEQIRGLLENDLPLRMSRPRRLVGSTPHGGGSFRDLLHRTHQGVAGTPMPAVGGTGVGLHGSMTNEEIQALTVYVRSLMTIETVEADRGTPAATARKIESASETPPTGERL